MWWNATLIHTKGKFIIADLQHSFERWEETREPRRNRSWTKLFMVFIINFTTVWFVEYLTMEVVTKWLYTNSGYQQYILNSSLLSKQNVMVARKNVLRWYEEETLKGTGLIWVTPDYKSTDSIDSMSVCSIIDHLNLDFCYVSSLSSAFCAFRGTILLNTIVFVFFCGPMWSFPPDVFCIFAPFCVNSTAYEIL